MIEVLNTSGDPQVICSLPDLFFPEHFFIVCRKVHVSLCESNTLLDQDAVLFSQ